MAEKALEGWWRTQISPTHTTLSHHHHAGFEPREEGEGARIRSGVGMGGQGATRKPAGPIGAFSPYAGPKCGPDNNKPATEPKRLFFLQTWWS